MLIIALALGIAFLFLSVSTSSLYGVTWDEPIQYLWGKMTFLHWQTGDAEYLSSMPGGGMYYGSLYYVLVYLSSQWFTSLGFSLVQSIHFLNIFIASLSIIFTAILGFQITNKRLIGACSGLLYFVFPSFIAHAQYNPKDIVLLFAVVLTSTFFVRALQKKSVRHFVFPSFLFGFSVAIKVSAVLFAPVIAVSMIFFYCQHRQMYSVQSLIILLLACSTAFLGGVILFWPSLWSDISLLWRSFLLFSESDFWHGHVLYFGQSFTGAALPWHYILLEYAMSMPAVLLLSFFAGLFFVIWRFVLDRFRSPNLLLVFLLLWIIVPFTISFKPNLVRYDSIRQFFFVLPAIVMISAIGIERIFATLFHKFSRSFFVVVCVLYVTFLSSEVIRSFPFGGSYRNEFIRWYYSGSLDRYFDTEYWGASYKQGIDWLNENGKQNAEICVPIADVLLDWYALRPDLTVGCSSQSAYVLFFNRYDREKQKVFASRTPVFTIQSLGTDLLKLYEIR